MQDGLVVMHGKMDAIKEKYEAFRQEREKGGYAGGD